jgi:diguanylate cyclase (GGDEF)-like protein
VQRVAMTIVNPMAAASGSSADAGPLALVHRIARIARRNLPLREALHNIVVELKTYLGCNLVACASVNLQLRRFVCEAVISDQPTKIHVGYGRDIGSGIVGEVADTGRALDVGDTAEYPNYVETLFGVRSELCVPVKHAGQVIAVINGESRVTNAFAGQRELMETVAEQVAGLIASAHLQRELHERVDLFAMMSELSRAALDSEGLQQTLDRIVQFVRQRFNLDICTILLLNQDGSELILKAHAGDSTFVGSCGKAWPIDLGVTGRAFRTGQAQFVADVDSDPDYVMGSPVVGAEYVLPIRFRDRLLGLMDLQSTSADSFGDDNRVILDALSDQVAGAIHLASTNQRLENTNRIVAEKSVSLEQVNEQLREANARLQRLSHLDGLTGIANRRRFDEQLDSEWRRALRHGHGLTLLMIDIDDFKPYNDGYGHQAGDECLRRVATALAQALHRGEDLIARYGGEEFAVLLPETGPGQALNCAQHLHSTVGALKLIHRYARAGEYLSVSIGVSSLVPNSGLRPSDFVNRADRALYAAKAQGRNRIAVAD